MNPTTNTGPELRLPAPVTNNVLPEQHVGQVQPLPEQTPNLAEQLPPAVAPNPAVPAAAAMPVAAIPLPASIPPAVAPTTDIVVPAVADDQDLIEKEWVAKAKEIVAKTRNDPYQQSQELTVFKNDYMQKRYDKKIKMAE